MEQPSVKSSIVIVTYNSMATIDRCISSVLNATDGRYELVVVDNGSADGTPAYLVKSAEGKPHVNVICNRDNLGYSAAANIGIRTARGEYVVLLNPDTVVRPGWLDHMREVFRHQRVGAVAPVSNYTAGLQFIGCHIPEQGINGLSYDQMHELIWERNRGQSVEAKLLMGFCLMLSRSAIEEVGLLDENLFLGCDDLDYCWRLRNHGYSLRIATDTFVEHAGQASFRTRPSEEIRRIQTASDIIFAKKLEAQYGRGNVPTSEELFGINIFNPPYDLWPSEP